MPHEKSLFLFISDGTPPDPLKWLKIRGGRGCTPPLQFPTIGNFANYFIFKKEKNIAFIVKLIRFLSPCATLSFAVGPYGRLTTSMHTAAPPNLNLASIPVKSSFLFIWIHNNWGDYWFCFVYYHINCICTCTMIVLYFNQAKKHAVTCTKKTPRNNDI